MQHLWAESDAALLQNDWLHGLRPCVVWLQHVGGTLPVVVVEDAVVVAA